MLAIEVVRACAWSAFAISVWQQTVLPARRFLKLCSICWCLACGHRKQRLVSSFGSHDQGSSAEPDICTTFCRCYLRAAIGGGSPLGHAPHASMISLQQPRGVLALEASELEYVLALGMLDSAGCFSSCRTECTKISRWLTCPLVEQN